MHPYSLDEGQGQMMDKGTLCVSLVSALHHGKKVETNPKPVIGSLEIREQYGLAPGTFFSFGLSLVEQKTPLPSSPSHLLLQLAPLVILRTWGAEGEGPLPTPSFIPSP